MKENKKPRHGKFLWVLMQDRGMNQADLAKLINVDPSHISRYFAGKKNLGIEKAKIVAKHFSIPLEYIYQ